MVRVIIESPYAGDVEENVRYARACILDSIRRGEAPFASHLLYPQVLNDASEEERELGMAAGFEWGKAANLVAVYMDRGLSPGMQQGIERAKMNGIPIQIRYLGAPWSAPGGTN